MNELFKEDLYIISVMVSMFLGPVMAIFLVVLAVMDSMGIYTVMRHLVENVHWFSIAYVAIMLGSTMFGFSEFGKVARQD